MSTLHEAVSAYARQVATLTSSSDATEATYYPAIQRLLEAILHSRELPFEVRVNLSQRRQTGGVDLPDLGFYDGAGDFVVVFGEVKTPAVEISDLAFSTDRGDQIGRYLAQTGVVLLANIRAFGLLAVDPDYAGDGPIPPEHRRLYETVDLWPSLSSMAKGRVPEAELAQDLAELIETAVTEFAPIAEPESLARILARQARHAKAALPAKFSTAVRPLLDDFAKALGLHFEDTEGEEFLRSSLIQTAFYGLFASWTLWRHTPEKREFHWRDLGEYLKIPFLGALFHEFQHPVRLKELGLAPYLDRATATLHRVAEERFFARFVVPDVVAQESPAAAAATHAILYFYEPFLEAFDPELRKELGVWYTPPEIVRYQVRKVDRILREELDCPRGFADNRVVVLDPCCGTGAYLLEVLRCVAEQLQEEGAGAALASKLLDAFCRRIIGFEILTAPFVVAQLQLYLILSNLGVEPDESHRPAIFLTNALTGWDGPEQLKLQFPELQQEHDAAQRVKREETIIVILGNPPYNRWAGTPIDEEQDLADHYKGIRRDDKGRQSGKSNLYARFGIRKHLLDDLYIRFLRLAEVRIGEEADYGVVSWISNSSYLTGKSHPLMRESLLSNFHEIWIDNLHGNRLASERTPWGDSCETIFNIAGGGPGIRVGTAISTFLKRKTDKTPPEDTSVLERDFWGRAHLKRQALLTALDLDELSEAERAKLAELPEGPREYEAVTPSASKLWKLVPIASTGGYEEWPALDELFPQAFMGVHTGKDKGVVDFSASALRRRIESYLDPGVSNAEMARQAPVLMAPANEFKDPAAFRKAMQADREEYPIEAKIRAYIYRPLDNRVLWYDTERRVFESLGEKWSGCLVQRYGAEFERATEFSNRFLCAVSQPRRRSETLPLTTDHLADLHLFDRGVSIVPAQVPPEPIPEDLFSDQAPQEREPTANVRETVWSIFAKSWDLKGDIGSSEAKSLVEDLFDLALAIGHSPQYQLDHKDSLAHDWLHLPIPKTRRVLEDIANLGEKVRHLLDPLEDPTKVLRELLSKDLSTLAVPSSRGGGVIREADLVVTISHFGAARGGWEERAPREDEAFRPVWGEATGDLSLNDDVYLANVPERVWSYELGGYPVLKKWLGYRDHKRRPDRPLSHDELDHLRSMVHRIGALLVLHEQLDAAYEKAIENAFTAEDLGL